MMEQCYPESPLSEDPQRSTSETMQDSLEGSDMDQHNQSPEGLEQDLDQVQDRVQHQDHNQDLHPNQELIQDQVQDQNQDQDLLPAAANQESSGESGGSVPVLVITQAEELLHFTTTEPNVSSGCSRRSQFVGPASAPVSPPAEPAEPVNPQRPADLVVSADPSLLPVSDGDMVCSDPLPLRSDSLSLDSEPTVSRMSEDDDSRSVTASSVMSLFHRVQLDPLERDWLRSSAVGNMATQRQLLSQESSLVWKKTALHWAAKQGRQEVVDMMLRSGADVNVRSGYTALHLASIHGHQHVIHSLINTYQAKTNIRDYHGKTAAQYWSGGSDVFAVAACQSGTVLNRGRQAQRYGLPSLLLTRSRSQGQLSLDFGSASPSASHHVLNLQL